MRYEFMLRDLLPFQKTSPCPEQDKRLPWEHPAHVENGGLDDHIFAAIVAEAEALPGNESGNLLLGYLAVLSGLLFFICSCAFCAAIFILYLHGSSLQ